ncbi:MAG: tetratricopeptide repeat protein [Candidatus Omnitrophica bacterium]|nr:tetratricopeptide repeat protein [Candidatus Omnitrophota bacterium]
MKKDIRNLLILGLILSAVFAAFWPSLFNGFTSWDDNIYVVENEMIRDLSWPTVKAIFTSEVSLNYTPLTILSFAIEYHFFGYKPFFFHLHNLLLHLLVTALVFVFAIRLSKSLTVAAIAALLFGIHPMHVESVAWVTERKDVLYGAFYMLSLICYWRYLTEKRKIFFVVSLMCGFLSILAKPMALSLPFILLLLDWFSRRKFQLRIFAEKFLFAIVMFPIAWLTYTLNSRVIAFHFSDALLTWLWTLIFYIKKFLLPLNLLPLYQLPDPVKITNPEFAFAIIATMVIIFFLIHWRKNRWFIFAFLFYFFSIFFLLRFDSSVDLCIVADRFMYLPSVGICILLAVYFRRLQQWAKVQKRIYYVSFIGVSLGCFILLGVGTFNQAKIWGDGIAFWNGVIKQYPDAAMAYNQRALAYKDKGDLKTALRDYTKAIIILPNYDFALTNRGIVHKELGMFEEAWNDHSQAIAVNPGFSEAYLNRGNVLFSVGDFQGAIEDYSKAIETIGISARRRSTPYRAEAYSRRGSGYFFAKNYDAALRDFNIALAVNPNNIVALDNRAIVFSIKGQTQKAMTDYNRSIKLAPHNPLSYLNRALLWRQTGDDAAALRDLDVAILLKPDYAGALQLKSEIQNKKSLTEKRK